MNYIELINQFWQTRRIVSFSSKEADLYFALLHECNIRSWENPFECSNRSIVASIGISEKTLIDARNRLKQKGLIDFKSGKRKEQSPIYILLNCKKDSLNRGKTDRIKVDKSVGINVSSLKTETEINVLSPDIDWRTDFSIYMESLNNAYVNLIKNQDFISEREKYHPGINIRLSMEKAYVEYWSKQAGWFKMKSTKYKEIDWCAVFTMTLNQKQNHVWLRKGEKNEPEESKVVYV